MKCPINQKQCDKIKCYHITNIDQKGNVENLDLCKNCFFNFNKPAKNDLIIHPSVDKNICKCGLSFDQYIKTGRLKCPMCYHTFQDFVSLLIDKTQKTPDNKDMFHKGKSPIKNKKASDVDFKDFLLKLEKQLSSCIKKENYEEANRLKFIIMGLKSLIEQHDKHADNSEQQKLIQKEINKLLSEAL